MTEKQKKLIDDAFDYADEHDKSTEWAIQFAVDKSHCSFDDVINYLAEKAGNP